MKNVLIIGATSRIAQLATEMLVNDDKINLTLFLRNKNKLTALTGKERIIVGDATNRLELASAIKGQDIVYASLAGDVITEAKNLVEEMESQQVKRLIWTSSLGIYDEVPGKFGELNNAALPEYLKTYRKAADIIEQSSLDYTIIRPAWLTNDDEIAYETTHANDVFKGTEVSRKSVAAYATEIIKNPMQDVRDSIGINKPNTDGDKPRDAVMIANGFDAYI